MATINNIVVSDNAFGTLASGLAVGDTSLTFTTGHGARFPAVTGSNVLYCCILNSTNVLEEIKITAHASGADTATITRGVGGTSAKVWAAGDRVEARLSSSALSDIAAGFLSSTATSTLTGDLTITGTATAAAAVVTGGLTISSATASGRMSAATAGGAVVATQAVMETGTSTQILVPVGRQHLHLLHPKAIIKCTSLGSSPFTATALFNTLSTLTPTTTGTGDWTLTWTTVLTNPSVTFAVEPESTSALRRLVYIRNGGLITTAVRFTCYDEAGASANPSTIYITIYGDAA